MVENEPGLQRTWRHQRLSRLRPLYWGLIFGFILTYCRIVVVECVFHSIDLSTNSTNVLHLYLILKVYPSLYLHSKSFELSCVYNISDKQLPYQYQCHTFTLQEGHFLYLYLFLFLLLYSYHDHIIHVSLCRKTIMFLLTFCMCWTSWRKRRPG